MTENQSDTETVYDLDYDKVRRFLEQDVKHLSDVYGFTMAVAVVSLLPGLGALWVVGVMSYVLYKISLSEDWLVETEMKPVEQEDEEEEVEE